MHRPPCARTRLYTALILCTYASVSMADEAVTPAVDASAPTSEVQVVAPEASAASVTSAAPAAASEALEAAPVAVIPTVSASAKPARVLETVVVSAAGYEQKITEAPSSISVISPEELKTRPYTTLIDAVRELEGVDVGETSDKTGQRTISMRGMGSDYTLILVDGKRQNNHGDIYPNSFGGNQFGHMPPLDAIERIEVIRGPASTLYGADAMGGVINVITKKVSDKWQGSVSHSRTMQTNDDYGNDITTDFNVMGPIIPGSLGLTLRGSMYNRMASNPTYDTFVNPAGETVVRSLGFGGGGKTVDNENESFGARLSWKPADNQTLWFDIDTSKQMYDNTPVTNDLGIVEYPVGTVDSLGAMLRMAANGRVEPRAGYAAEQEFTRDTWALVHEGKWDIGNSFVSLSYVETKNNGRTMPFSVAERNELQGLWNTVCEGLGGTTGASGRCPLNSAGYNNANAWNNLSEAQKLAIFQGELSGAEYEQLLSYLPRGKRTMESNQFTLDAKLDMPYQWNGDHVAVVGAQVIRGELVDGVFGMEQGASAAAQEHNMFSIFAEDTWYITQPFALTTGLRLDDHEVFGDQLSPRVYGVYTVNSDWTIKGGVATGFKTPKTTQLYDGVVGYGSQGTSPQFGNPNLKPETSVSSEIAAYWQHPEGHNFNVTLFKNDFEDKIASQPCGGAGQQDCASTGDFGSLGYTTSTRTTNIDDVVIQGAELAGRYVFNDSWSVRGNYTYTDSEQRSGEQKGLPLGDSAKHMANLTLNWQATDRFSVFLTNEYRADRFDEVDEIDNEEMYFKNYTILHLGANFVASDAVTFNARINNLLDRDFTTYKVKYNDINGDGDFSDTDETRFYDDYNNKDKDLNIWVGVNVKF